MENPIIKRELLGTLRTRRALVVQILLVLGLASLVLLRWPTDARVDFDGMRAQQVLSVFGYGLLTGVILLAPVFPATSIVREKEEGTLALLLNSPMNAWSIATGKLVGSLGFILLLIILSAPAAAACFAMGGINAQDLGMMYLVLLALAFQYATLGLLISSFAGSVDSALRLTYGSVLLLAVISLGPHQFLGSMLTGAADTAVEWVRCLSPMPAMAEAMGNETVLSGGVRTSSSTWRFVLLAMASGAGFFLWTALRLNQRLFDKPRDAGRITNDRSRGEQAFRRIMYLWFFDPQRRSGLIGPLTNPVMVKEQRCRRFGRGHWMMRLIGGCLILSLMFVLATTLRSSTWGVESLGGMMVALQMGLVILITPTLASGLISSERESGGWQLLHMTPLSAVSIVVGKLMSVMWTLLLLLLATVPAYAVLIAIEPGQREIVIQVLTSLALTAAMALLVSAAISSIFPRTAPATVTSYIVLIILCVGTLLFWLGEDAPFTQQTVEAVLLVNPLAGALNLIQTPGFATYHLVPTNWWIILGFCGVSLFVLVLRTWQLTRPQ